MAKPGFTAKHIGRDKSRIIDRILGRTVGRCIAQFQILQIKHGHPRSYCHGNHIDSLIHACGSYGLRSQHLAACRVKQQFQGHLHCPRIIRSMIRRMDIDFFVGHAQPLKTLFIQAGHGDGLIEDFADRGALSFLVRQFLPEDV